MTAFSTGAKRGPKPYHGRSSTQDDYAISYVQEYSKCGKPNCKCATGQGHGPYWYSYQQSVTGRIMKKYVGKQLPASVDQGERAIVSYPDGTILENAVITEPGDWQNNVLPPNSNPTYR